MYRQVRGGREAGGGSFSQVDDLLTNIEAVLLETVGVDTPLDLLVGPGAVEAAQPGQDPRLERSPHHLQTGRHR